MPAVLTNYNNFSFVETFNIKIIISRGSHPEVFHKVFPVKRSSKNSRKIHKKKPLCWNLQPTILLKRDSNISLFLWIFFNFPELPLLQNTSRLLHIVFEKYAKTFMLKHLYTPTSSTTLLKWRCSKHHIHNTKRVLRFFIFFLYKGFLHRH